MDTISGDTDAGIELLSISMSSSPANHRSFFVILSRFPTSMFLITVKTRSLKLFGHSALRHWTPSSHLLFWQQVISPMPSTLMDGLQNSFWRSGTCIKVFWTAVEWERRCLGWIFVAITVCCAAVYLLLLLHSLSLSDIVWVCKLELYCVVCLHCITI